MNGTKVVRFDFEFEYPENGVYVSTNEITLTAPGSGKFHVHNTIHAYVIDALFNVAKRAAEMQGAENARRAAEEEEDETEEKAPPTGAQIMEQMALGLGVERFPTFMEYAKKSLTNCHVLARVGEGRTPLTDEVWEQLEKSGGVAAHEEIIGSFAGFFLKSPAPRKGTGSSASPTSVSPSKVGSTTSTRAASRSKN